MGWFFRHFLPKLQPANKPAHHPPLTSPEPTVSPPVVAAPQQAASDAKLANAVPWMQRDRTDADFFEWLFEGGRSSQLFTNQHEENILAQVKQALRAKNAATDMVRRMPGVIPQLLQSLRTEDFSGAELARQISHDVVLVAEVIRIANSALYKTPEEITSIERAVLVLGHTGLRQLITSVAFKPIIDLKSGHFTRTIAPKIWEHSEKCARASRMLAEGETVQAFEAFLAGLIQNAGLIVALRFVDQLTATTDVGSVGFCNSLAALGRKLSVDIAREWHFPEAIARAVAEQDASDTNTALSPIGSILALGDHLGKISMLAGVGCLTTSETDLVGNLPEKAALCLADLKA